MKIHRSLAPVLVIVATLGVVAFAAVMSPLVQTWYVRRLFAQQTEWHIDVEQVFAGFSQVDITGLRVERSGLVVTAPKVTLELSVWRALRDRQLAIRRLVAKNWTLKVASAATTATQARNLISIVGGWTLPCAVSIDDATIDGDLVSPQDETTSLFHLVGTGGGVGAGRIGKFAAVANVYDARLPENAISVQADVAVATDDGRSLRRIEVEGRLAPGAGPKVVAAAGAAWNFRLAAERHDGAEHYELAVDRESRPLVGLRGSWDANAGKFAGEWSVGLRESDAKALGLGQLLPALLEGSGKVTASPDFERVGVTGKVRTSGQRWPAFAEWLAPLAPTTLTAEFEFVREPAAVHFTALTLVLDGDRLIATLRTLQPFNFVPETKNIQSAEPARDWAEVDLRGWPLAWFAGRTGTTTITGGDLKGRLALGVEAGIWRLQSLDPLAAEDVTLRHGDRLLAKSLTAEARVKAQVGPAVGEWQFELAPLTLARGGSSLARIDAKFARPAAQRAPTAVTAKWTLDLAALKASGVSPDLGWLSARNAAGEVTGTFGDYADLLVPITIVGADDKDTASGTIRYDRYGDGSGAITAPLTLTFGRAVSDVKIDWKWRAGASKSGIEVKFAGKNVVLDHLRALAAPLVFFGHGDIGGGLGAGQTLPFWGDWIGQAGVDIERLQLADRELVDVGGYLKIAPDRIELLGGHGGPPEHSLSQIDATLTFDPARPAPYALKATMAPFHRDAEEIFGVAPKGKDPIFTGRFEVEHSLSATGASLPDLIARREDNYQLSGANGIVRMLKPDVIRALPASPDESGVVNTLDAIGTGFLKVFGGKSKSLTSGQIKVSAEMDAVLDFDSTMAEIGYDTLKLTAERRADGTMQVSQFELLGSDVHLTGAGSLGGGAGTGWLERPVDAQLTLGVKGRLVDLLKTAGLLSGKKDAAGYELVDPAIKFGGTLGRLTQDEWRARLAAVAHKPSAKAAK